MPADATDRHAIEALLSWYRKVLKDQKALPKILGAERGDGSRFVYYPCDLGFDHVKRDLSHRHMLRTESAKRHCYGCVVSLHREDLKAQIQELDIYAGSAETMTACYVDVTMTLVGEMELGGERYFAIEPQHYCSYRLLENRPISAGVAEEFKTLLSSVRGKLFFDLQ